MMPVYKSSNGKWYCSFYYTDSDGKRKRKKKEGFKTKREAAEYERSFVADTRHSYDIPFSEMCDLYLADLQVRVRPSSLQTARRQISSCITPFFSDKTLQDISAADIRRWQNTLLDSGRKKSYIRLVNARLNCIFSFAQKYYDLPENPMAKTGGVGSAKSREMEFWTKAEFDLFMTSITKPDLSCAFYVLFYTGLRCGELLALTVGDIDFDKNEIAVNKTLTKVGKQIIVNPPKTPESKRVVTVPATIMHILSDYVDRLYRPEPQDRLFANLTSTRLRDAILKGSKATGVKFIRIHDLRHSHASWLIEHGYPIQVVSERLGHSNTQMTLNVYAHLYPNKQTELAESIDKLLTESVPNLPEN